MWRWDRYIHIYCFSWVDGWLFVCLHLPKRMWFNMPMSDTIKIFLSHDFGRMHFLVGPIQCAAVVFAWSEQNCTSNRKTKKTKRHTMSGINIDANGLASGTGMATNNKSLPQSPASMVSSESETQSISDEQTTSSIRQVNFYLSFLNCYFLLCFFLHAWLYRFIKINHIE